MSSANTVEVRRPRVTISDEATDSVIIQWRLPVSSLFDGAPSVRYSAHKAGGAMVDSPTANEIIEKIAEAQTAMFDPPGTKTVTIFDGKNSFVFTGYDSGPHHDIMFGGVNTGRNLVHRCARLFFLNTSIYGQVPAPQDKGWAEEVDYASVGATPCETIKLVLQSLITRFNSSIQDEEDSVSLEIKKRIHSDNEKIINEEWYPILDASTESGITNFAAAAQEFKSPLYQSIAQVYLSGAADFSIIVAQFESMFQMQFVPDPQGLTPGKFIPLRKLLEDPEEKETNIVSLSMNPGPKKFLAVSGVAMRGIGESKPAWGEEVPYRGSQMISWPTTLPASGQIIVIQQPNWIPTEAFPTSIPTDGIDLNIPLNQQLVQAAVDQVLEAYNIAYIICRDICRLMYGNAALGDANATIVTPLDVTWEVGKRYTIKQVSDAAGGGSVLFSGFLSSVQHRVSSNPSRPEATTQLTFTHVEANGFTLPNK